MTFSILRTEFFHPATDANGNQTTFAYNSSGGVNGLMTSATRPAGNQPLTQTFDATGRVSDPDGQSFQHNDSGLFGRQRRRHGHGATAGVGVTQANDSNMNLTSQQRLQRRRQQLTLTMRTTGRPPPRTASATRAPQRWDPPAVFPPAIRTNSAIQLPTRTRRPRSGRLRSTTSASVTFADGTTSL